MDKGEKLVKKPTYPGGPKAMDAFIKSHLKYPEEAFAKKITGTVAVVVDVDENGFVSKTKIKKSVGYGCDEEASRLCKLLKFSTAAKRKNRKLTFHRTINIHFRLKEVPAKSKVVAPKAPVPALPKTVSASTSPQIKEFVYSFVPSKKPMK